MQKIPPLFLTILFTRLKKTTQVDYGSVHKTGLIFSIEPMKALLFLKVRYLEISLSIAYWKIMKIIYGFVLEIM
ncbi:hypothetical protein NL300_28680, partial [Klebsiella pneumoniae]|nr:hypothetical protein [Klebsiella pneumoniae]